MPVRNVAPYVDVAIRSVLMQSFSRWELLVVDDASSDGTSGRVSRWALKEPRLTVVRNESHKGLSACLNLAVSLASYPLIARLDGDDIWYRQHLELQLTRFLSRPDLILCGTAADIMDEIGRNVAEFHPPTSDAGIRRFLLYDNPFVHSSVMFRRHAFYEAGGYPAGATYEDYSLWISMAHLGRLMNTEDVLVRHRIQRRSYTRRIGEVTRRTERLKLQLRAAREVGPLWQAGFPIARTCVALASAALRSRS